MKSVQAIGRFISNAWHARPLLFLLSVIISLSIFFRVGHEIINRLWGVELADKLFMDAMTLLWMVLVGLTPIGLAIYAMMRLVRWFAGKKEP